MTINLKTFTWRYALPLWRWYFFGLLALAATNIIMLEIPQLAKLIVNTIAESKDLGPMANIALAIIGLGLLQIIIRSLSRVLIFWPGRTLESVAKNDIFARVLRIPQQVLMNFGMGDLISRLSNDMGQLRAFYAFAVLQAANLAFLSVFTVSQMLAAHKTLTIACLAPLTLMVLITRYAMPQMQKYSKRNQEAVGRLSNRVTEAFVNVHILQSNAAEKAFVDRTDSDNDAVYESNIRLVFVRNVVFPLMICLAGLAQVTVLFYGGNEVIAGRLTVGDILAFNIYIGFISFPLTALGFILALYQRAVTAAERLSEVEDAPQENESSVAIEKDSTGAIATDSLLSVKNLTWIYPKVGDLTSKPFGLHDISFEIKEGTSVGLFGPIGSGKSTLFSLITRLYEPPRGTIFWKGVDVLDMQPTELRRQVGLAQQTVHLFSDTIEANFRMGIDSDTASQKDLEVAAENAQILKEIMSFDKQWQTEIGENGIRLSGGQKQRIALARLFLRKPKVLILDDVVSAVDHETEAKLITFFHSLNQSILIASHRPSALQDCDEVLILEEGHLKAKGNWATVAHHVRSI